MTDGLDYHDTADESLFSMHTRTRIKLETLLLVGAGAFVGANLRYLLGMWLGDALGRSFPYGTLFINISGSFLLALFLGWAARQTALAPELRALIAVGFCGGYTTYSSFANETIALLQAGDWTGAGLYIALTNGLCIGGVLPGLWLGSKL